MKIADRPSTDTEGFFWDIMPAVGLQPQEPIAIMPEEPEPLVEDDETFQQKIKNQQPAKNDNDSQQEDNDQ